MRLEGSGSSIEREQDANSIDCGSMGGIMSRVRRSILRRVLPQAEMVDYCCDDPYRFLLAGCWRLMSSTS
jgi:hypothetical protein